MQFFYQEKTYPVIIVRKNIKNTYIRINASLEIIVHTNLFQSDFQIENLLREKESVIQRMIQRLEEKKLSANEIRILGKIYDIIYCDSFEKVEKIDHKIFVKDDKALKCYIRQELSSLFQTRLLINYDRFEENIPFPKLKIRNMKTRWGVCNTKDKIITLNTQLLEYPLEELDYVIIHELAHFIEANHSPSFWKIVEKYIPDYKKRRKKLKQE